MNKIEKIALLYNTIRYLKAKQIYYRFYYLFRKKLKRFNYHLSLSSNSKELVFNNFINNYISYENNIFTFLNLSKKFDKIDWNYSKFGKLWVYNLTYFDYLNQKDISKEDGLKLIYDFIDDIETIKYGLEPYPVSLRVINWIKFLSKFNIKDKKINDSLFAQSYILYDNLEYHLLGNHLLENGFALYFAGYYFNDKKLLDKAKEILKEELNEQILEDGGHFELSPMYHQIILYRLFDTINLIKSNQKDDILEFLEGKAIKMLSWLKNITFENGDIPLLNDSTDKIAPISKKLFEYADLLNIRYINNIKLKDSGYRKIIKNNYECILDIGQIGPDYIPGHAHGDTFNFVLNINNKPFIIDTGISTYETGETRDYEKSTKAHNTVEINNKNSSEIWGGFRVANRARIIKVEEKEDFIKATHDGYKPVLHTREWIFKNDRIIIKDSLNRRSYSIFRLHFHPSITGQEIKKRIKVNNCKIVENFVAFTYNKRIKTKILEVEFEKELEVEIVI